VKRAGVLLGVLLLAGCGGSKADHATLVDVDAHRSSVTFRFDVAPDRVTSRYADGSMLAECGSGLPIRPAGRAFVVVHFLPAQSADLPERLVMPSGPLLEAAKVCDFEADVGWALGLERKLPFDVSRDGATVTVTFGG
jgi:hypothetical protein